MLRTETYVVAMGDYVPSDREGSPHTATPAEPFSGTFMTLATSFRLRQLL
jgi:hypothetical protein